MVLVALHGHWPRKATRTLVIPGQATSCGGATCTLYTRESLGRELVVALHGHCLCKATRTTSWSGATCTLYTRDEACQGTTMVLVPLAVRGDQNPGGSWTSHLMRRGDLYTVNSGKSLPRNHHGSGRLARPLTARDDQNRGGSWTSHLGGATCTLNTRGVGRKLVEPPRFWSPCTATNRATRPELWNSGGSWTSHLMQWGDLYTVHSARAREEACQGTTMVLVALHGHWRCEATRTLVVPGQATSCGGATCTLYTRRKLVKEPPRLWSPCTATGGARRPEPWWFLDKPPHAVGRPVHCRLGMNEA